MAPGPALSPGLRTGHATALAGLALGGASAGAVAAASGAPLEHWPWPVQLVAWAAVFAVRADPVQLLLAGGDPTRRNAVRTALGCVLVTAALVASGLGVLVPLGCTMVVAIHLDSHRASALAGGGSSTALLSGLVALGSVTGALPSSLPPATLLLVLFAGAGLALATVGNHSLLAARAESVAGDLAREQMARQRELLHAAVHDPLTGLLNRRGLVEGLDVLLGRPNVAAGSTSEDSSAGTPGGTAVAFIDLDGFKAVNDVHGHQVGDELLVAVAGRLTGALRGHPRDDGRPGDLLARLGGDEFVAVLAGVPSAAAAAQVADRLHRALSAPLSTSAGEVTVGASVGLSFTAAPVPAAELLQRADAEMYARKRSRGVAVPAPR